MFIKEKTIDLISPLNGPVEIWLCCNEEYINILITINYYQMTNLLYCKFTIVTFKKFTFKENKNKHQIILSY
jgi:hypothetical protein